MPGLRRGGASIQRGESAVGLAVTLALKLLHSKAKKACDKTEK